MPAEQAPVVAPSAPPPSATPVAATRPALVPAPSSNAPLSAENPLAAEFATAPALATLRGDATYYADKFAGRKTASGEVYDPGAFTAAHRKLPFGTVVRVKRTDNGRVVYVRVTDRGPFGNKRRIIDLSRAAAAELEMLRAGVVKVVVEVVKYGPKRR